MSDDQTPSHTSAPEDLSGADLVERVVDSRTLHRGRYLTFRVDTIERPDGSRSTRDIVGHPGAVAVVAIDADDRVVFVRQYRLAAGAVLLEIVAGGLDPAPDGTPEDPEHAARRELAEEAALEAGTWRALGSFFTAPGFTEEHMHLFLATDLRPLAGAAHQDEDERLIVIRIPFDEALAAADAGEIIDAKTLLGLYRVDRLRRSDL